MCRIKSNGPMYYTDGHATVCLLMEGGVPVARGIGIHSRCDEFIPRDGRKYALARANEALGRKQDCSPIRIEAPRGNTYDWFDSSLVRDHYGEWKGYYMPVLTGTERQLLQNDGSMVRKGKNHNCRTMQESISEPIES